MGCGVRLKILQHRIPVKFYTALRHERNVEMFMNKFFCLAFDSTFRYIITQRMKSGRIEEGHLGAMMYNLELILDTGIGDVTIT
jgi:hypothetical protein